MTPAEILAKVRLHENRSTGEVLRDIAGTETP